MMSPVMSTEERLRAAARAAADTVAPGSAPPLRLPDGPAVAPGRGRRNDRRRWLQAMTPLAAAAAVAAVVIASLTLTRGVHTSSGGAQSPARPVALHGAPRYYAALANTASPSQAVIGDTATGAVIATVKPPKPYGTFDFVSGAADDRTFVLAAQRWWPITSGPRGLAAQNRDNAASVVYFRLRFDPATGAARLTRLYRLPLLESTEVAGIGLSPDGTRLALALRSLTVGRSRPGSNGPGSPGEPGGHGPGIQVWTLATGASRGWVWPGASWVGNVKPLGQPLSWTADGRMLAFQGWHGNDAQVRLLDTAAPGTDLRSGRLIARFSDSGPLALGGTNSLITPDGNALVAATARYQQHPVRSELQISEFRTSTGTMFRSLARWRLSSHGVSWQDVLWTNSSGSTLIVVTPPGTGRGTGSLNRAVGPLTGILTSGGQFTPLPGLSIRSSDIAW